MTNPEKQIEGLLAPYSAEIQSFAQDLRTWLRKDTSPAYELVGKSGQSVNIGYGFTTTAWDCFCAIIVYRKHINISLPSGASLDDPDKILHGTGSRVRHIKISCLEDAQTAPVRRLLAEARNKALFLERDRDDNGGRIETVVKTAK